MFFTFLSCFLWSVYTAKIHSLLKKDDNLLKGSQLNPSCQEKYWASVQVTVIIGSIRRYLTNSFVNVISDWEDWRSFVIQRPSFLEAFSQHDCRDRPPPDHVRCGGAEDHTAGRIKSHSDVTAKSFGEELQLSYQLTITFSHFLTLLWTFRYTDPKSNNFFFL